MPCRVFARPAPQRYKLLIDKQTHTGILFHSVRYKIIQVGVFVVEVVLRLFRIRRIDAVPTFQRHVLPVPVLPYRPGYLTGFAQPDGILALLCRQGCAREDFVIPYRLLRTLWFQPHIAGREPFPLPPHSGATPVHGPYTHKTQRRTYINTSFS